MNRIGVDLDETIVQSFSPIMGHINHRYGTDWGFEDLVHHDWHTIPGFPCSVEQITREWEIFISHDSKGSLLPMVPGSNEALSLLKKDGYDLQIITARDEAKLGKETERWISQNFPGIFTHIHYSNHYSKAKKRTKSSIYLEQNIDTMIDDNLDFAIEMAAKGITTYVFERPWNRQRTETHPNIQRINNWEEFTKKFHAKT